MDLAIISSLYRRYRRFIYERRDGTGPKSRAAVPGALAFAERGTFTSGRLDLEHLGEVRSLLS